MCGILTGIRLARFNQLLRINGLITAPNPRNFHCIKGLASAPRAPQDLTTKFSLNEKIRLKRAGRLATAPGSWQADAFLVAKVIASSGYKGSLRRVAGI